jgi:AcrR family transcriptional regulator
MNISKYPLCMSTVKSQKPAARAPYSSAVRESGARQTRHKILEAARELILSEGYNKASTGRIAEAAGVARPTVTAVFGSKPALMKALVDEALAGDDEPIPVAQRPWFQPVWDAGTLEQLTDAYARVCVLIGSRTALIFDALGRAADSSPDLASLWKTMTSNRRLGAAMVVRHGLSIGAINPDADTESYVDALWVHNDPALYRSLVITCSWNEEVYTRWLARQMYAALTQPYPVP